MWLRGAAIKPVPRYAVISTALVEQVERDDDWDFESNDDERSMRFPMTQEGLFAAVNELRGPNFDEFAKAFHHIVTRKLLQIFETAFPGRVGAISAQDLGVVQESLTLEEELRATHLDETFELDDVVQREQPAVVAYLQGVLEDTLEAASDREVDLDDVHVVYRRMLGYVLALSHAVAPPPGIAGDRLD